MSHYGDWAAQQLAEFLAALSGVATEEDALRTTVERAADALEAEIALLVRPGRIVAMIGFPEGAKVDQALLELPVKGEAALDVSVLGLCRATSIEVDQHGMRLVLARAGAGSFDRNDQTLLRGMARVLALTLRMLRTLDAERRLRELSESHAGELRERHDLSERRFRVLFDEAGIGISLLNLATGEVETNQALQLMLGRTAEQLCLPNEFDRLTHPDDREKDRIAFDRFVAGELQDLRLEKRFLAHDGRVVWADVSFTHLRGPDTEPHFALALHEDITERKLAEEERARLEAELRQAQKLEAIGRLAGGVAHDFNNLLTAISGFNEIALLQAKDDELRDNLLEIELAAKRAAELTRQLLAFGRKQVLRPRVLDLNAVVFEMEGMLRRLIGEHIELRVALGGDLDAIHADRGQLEQVLANLTINARDAMGGGGVLTIETWQVELDERAARRAELEPGRYAGLVVGDTGHGMDAETSARAFEPFFTTKEPGKGTGLGLATVYGIVKQSGGSVSVASSPGRGARFTILLPGIQADPDAEPTTTVGALPRGSETVLVVEDEAVVRRFVQETLERQGYHVLTARDAPDALAQLGNGTPIDVLLTDVVMPRMSGRELAQRLVASRPSVKVLYMSGYTEDAVVHAGAAAGAFLAKPFGRADLVRKVRELLDSAA
jgi:two-component system cell cycle sensor histidine kinase/response regulator CckA